MDAVAFAQCIFMEVDLGLWRTAQDLSDVSRMIIMSVADGYYIRCGQHDAKGLCVVEHGGALARIKQDVAAGYLDPQRKPMLNLQPEGGMVVGEYGD